MHESVCAVNGDGKHSQPCLTVTQFDSNTPNQTESRSSTIVNEESNNLLVGLCLSDEISRIVEIITESRADGL